MNDITDGIPLTACMTLTGTIQDPLLLTDQAPKCTRCLKKVNSILAFRCELDLISNNVQLVMNKTAIKFNLSTIQCNFFSAILDVDYDFAC